MTTATRTSPLSPGLDRRVLRPGTVEEDVRRRFAGSSDGGRLTLERRLESVWEGLSAGGRAACPVCTGEMSGHGVCRGCGSRLA